MSKTKDSIIKNVITNRKLLFSLAKNDFKTRFAGSFLGIVWGFIQPVVTVLVYWFAFEKGLKMAGANLATGGTFPYVLWLSAGIVPWFFLQEAFMGGTSSLREYDYLVKKVVFNVEILPMVKVLSAVFTHIFFILFVIIFYAFYGYSPDFYLFQVIYYSFCVLVLSIGLSYITSAITVFVNDMTQIVNILLQIGIWITPIMWNIDTADFSPRTMFVLKLNPMFYIVQGYRDAFINKIGFWEHQNLTIYFWIFTLVVCFIGGFVFKRLRNHFADIL